MPDFIRIHPDDTVTVALRTAPAGTAFEGVTALEEIPQGHKMAVVPMKRDEDVVKYGLVIGRATEDITPR